MAEEWKWRTIRLKAWAWDALDALAHAENRNRSEQARQLIEEGLRRRGMREPKPERPPRARREEEA